MAHPDANKMHPIATGKALALTQKHTKEALLSSASQNGTTNGDGPAIDLIFYAGWFCPFVQRTWIALEERGINYEYNECNPYKKEKHFLEINPKGLVPAIEYKGKALYESLILVEFLEDAYPSNQKHLLPADPYDRARVRLWTDFISKSVVSGFYKLLQAKEDDAKRQEYKESYIAALKTFANEISGDPWFLPGPDLTMVDVALAPFAVRTFLLEKHRGFNISDAGPIYEKWHKAILERPSVVDTCSDQDKLEGNYDRYLQNEAQSEVAKATREGKVIP